MEAPTGYRPASELPKSLWSIMSVLMKENGLRSWQVYSEKVGVSIRIRFGQPENGGQAPMSEGSKICFNRKSPSQIKRDERKATERRMTRSRANMKGDVAAENCEMPRSNDYDSRNSPIISEPYSPLPLPAHTPEQPSLLTESSMNGHNPTGQGTPVSSSADHDLVQGNVYKTCNRTKTNAEHDLDSIQCSTPQEGLNGASVHEDSDESASDTEDEYGANISMELRYNNYYRNNPKPIDRRCSYCGTKYGSTARIIRQCDYPQCGRKVCQTCFKKKHLRHLKYMSENFDVEENG